MNPSERVQAIRPSPTLAVSARAAELRAEGRDVINLGAGEPDFDTPEHIKDAARHALNQGFTKYTAPDGMPELKRAIADKLLRENGLRYAHDEIVASCGAKHSIFNLAQALLNPGDEVIVPAPYWVSYVDIVRLAGGVPVVVPTTAEQRFKLTPEQLTQAITPRTRLLFLNSPSNPTGACYTRAELEALVPVLESAPHVVIATDDIYEHILWADEPFTNILMVAPQLRAQTVVLNGVSKAYSMTGWRIGYAAAPAAMARAMKKIQSQSTSNPTSIAQAAAVQALSGDQACVRHMVRAFEERHRYVHGRLRALDGVQCRPADGTFYLFPDFSRVAERLGASDDVDLAQRLLNDANVAVVPGSAFGAPGHLRFSFATSKARLREAFDRLAAMLQGSTARAKSGVGA